MSRPVTILGIFACDLVWIAERLPVIGETVLARDFRVGPGGKGSNQAVAAKRAGAQVNFLTRLGADQFGDMARKLYADEGIAKGLLIRDENLPTGAAFIYVNAANGENAIIVNPGSAGAITRRDVDAAETHIAGSSVFLTQLETPLEVTIRGLELARRHGVTTIFNPAPAAALPDSVYPLVDYFTPNETEAATLAGFQVESVEDAQRAAQFFLSKGVGNAVITLGEQGVLTQSAEFSRHVPAFQVANVVDTTGAGDAFNGGFAAALANGESDLNAVRFGCATGALSVSRPGTAASMPDKNEVRALLATAVEIPAANENLPPLNG